MKNFFKKAIAAMLTVCLLVSLATIVAPVKVVAIDNTGITKTDLSSYRKTYSSGDNVGYNSNTETSLPFNALSSLSVQSTGADAFRLVNDSSKGCPVIAISSATDFSIIFSTKDIDAGNELGNGYKLSSDSWGATQTGNNPQTIYADGSKLATGEIKTGALVVQKSYNGTKYIGDEESGKLSNGYYTTNYLSAFGGQDKIIYTPSGEDLKRGVYISVNFYYETSKYSHTERFYTDAQKWDMHLSWIGLIYETSRGPQGKKDVYNYGNIRESYTFYVVEDNPKVVTLNNLTTSDKTEIVGAVKPSSQNEEEYKVQSEQYNNYLNSIINQILPTMYDGDMSTTGIRINVTANPYLTIKLKRNGKEFPLPEIKVYYDDKGNEIGRGYEVTDSGKYDITIASYSKQKSLTLYVDNVSADEAYIRYFGEKVIYNGQAYGDAFLDYSPNNPYGNMRVFDAYSDVPVFVGSLTLNLKAQFDQNALPLSQGVVTNKSTGNVVFVENNQITLNKCGEYEVMFSTNDDYYDSVVLGNTDIEIAGDVRVYKFNFKLVAQDSDTTVNKQLLSTSAFKDLSIASPSDYIPLFYGVKRFSASKGEVIVAFADRESALQYAKDVVWGEIETHTDASGNTYWLIPNTDNPFGAKIESYSGWKNAQVVRELAEKMVEERHFDLTKSATYLTLEKSVEDFTEEGVEVTNLLTNLQLASLEKSVVVWYSTEQRSAATITNINVGSTDVIKFVGKQSYALLSKDESGSYTTIVSDERDHRFIKDALGIDSYTLTAEDAQDKEMDLNYDEGLYQQLKSQNCASGLVLITEANIYGNVTAQYYVYYIADGYQPAKLTFSADDQQMEVSQDVALDAQSFSKVILENISEYADPYSYIRVINKSSSTPTTYYSIQDAIGLEFAEFGEYEVAIIDRFGNSLSYYFSIK